MVAAPEGGHSPLSGVFSAISPVGRWVRVGGCEWRVGHVRVAQRRHRGRHPRPPAHGGCTWDRPWRQGAWGASVRPLGVGGGWDEGG